MQSVNKWTGCAKICNDTEMIPLLKKSHYQKERFGIIQLESRSEVKSSAI